MSKSIFFNFQVEKSTNKIKVDRSFDAPLDLVWAAWTEADILDQWWAPKPYRTETKSLNFKVGGQWLYAMISPEGEKHWCLFDYHKIEHEKCFAGMDAFCDEEAKIADTKPRCFWENTFTKKGETTLVNIDIHFDTLEDLEQIIEMGFKEGFTMGLNNLDQYIQSQFYLRKQKKPNNLPRVSTYINMPGNTEQAFNFYKKVFRTEFVQGIQRFAEAPTAQGQAPMDDSLKNMVLHVELPLIGGHLLMGTDAPKEMGFTVVPGNNMHINLEPDTREEADRLFNELSEGGKIEMPIQDMFWGAYFGSFTDKFGINWMVNYQKK